MKLALNGTSLLSPLTGIGQYTWHLTTELQATPDVDLELFYGTGWLDHLAKEAPRKARTLKSLARRFLPNSRTLARLYQQRRFDARAKGGRFDLYHEPNYLAFKFDGPSVVTVHDLSWLRFPHTHPGDRIEAMNRYLKPAIDRASLILTDSDFVRHEVVEEFRLDPARVVSIALGVETAFQPMDAAGTAQALQAHGLVHGQYLLAVGTLEPRKNLGVALKAYMQLPLALRTQCPLVLAGMTGWKTSALEQQLDPLVRAGHIRQLGYLPREDLMRVIAGARALVYPSIYEGFGLPPLEAMACGVPVIASRVSSIPEVVGDTGVLLPADDVDAFSQAMQTLVDDDALHGDLSARALTRSAQFTWPKCAADTMAAYRLAIQAGRP
ncbi:glycosyltransferase family 4 protein [Variovorax terrae]|uniref:Glycosyltransferase family 4 protein n=1 Tax=Variovorax terrae TaxID=2923278 RepID=A0A9X1VQC9_9BURK|nr:glycosyltransferase family 1 protein [Variovorax terrae]MCJ0761861.1 glycosyltransferase family 4 protein [Variovorax terrae]